MTSAKTYYDLLGVSYDASTEEIHKAYVRLREEYKDDPGKLHLLKVASLTLENSRSRKDYDRRNKIDQRRWREGQGIQQPSPTEPDASPPRSSRLKRPVVTEVPEPPQLSRLKKPVVTEVPEAPSPVEVGIKPVVIDFWEVEDWEAALPQKVWLRSEGKGDWSGKVHCTVPWLEVEPSIVKCAAGKEVTLEVRLNAKAAHLPIGTHDKPEALLIEGEGKKESIGVRLTLRKPQVRVTMEGPHIEIPSKFVDLGRVEDWQRPVPSQSIRLQNIGNQDWRGTATCKLHWLEIKPSAITCPTGKELTLEIRCKSDVDLAGGTYNEPEALLIEGEGQRESIWVRLSVGGKKA